MKLEKLRNEISELDKTILKLVAKRMYLVMKIRNIKKKNCMPVKDKIRERVVKVLWNKTANSYGLNITFAKKILNLILRESVRLQEKI